MMRAIPLGRDLSLAHTGPSLPINLERAYRPADSFINRRNARPHYYSREALICAVGDERTSDARVRTL